MPRWSDNHALVCRMCHCDSLGQVWMAAPYCRRKATARHRGSALGLGRGGYVAEQHLKQGARELFLQRSVRV
ncbi:MAG: hypothetical protein AAF411_29675, partial [Myxococcota bacterium]